VHRDDLIEAMLHFVKQRSDETRVVRQIDAAINRAVDMGFLSALKTEDDAFEVRRVLKAHLTADKLAQIKTSMATHAEENA
jgi:hypothetical protein